MKITKVEAIPLWADFAREFGGAEHVPAELSRPAATYTRDPLTGQGAVLIRIHTDDGLIGLGETMGRPGAVGMAALTTEILSPLLVGEDPRAIAALWERCAQAARFTPAIVSGVDIALWDLAGKFHGVPVHVLLGGPVRDDLPCYASPVPLLADPAESALRALEFTGQGFRALKIKIGRGAEVDAAHVVAVRDAVGPGVRLLADCNDAYSPAEAVQVAAALAPAGLYWFEEPIRHDHRAELARLRAVTGQRIASGEWLGELHQLRELVASGAVDVVMPNIVRCGGITGLRRLAEFAAHHHVAVSPHGVGGPVALAASVEAGLGLPDVTLYEYNRLFNPLRDTMLTAYPPFVDGALRPTGGPGLGVELDEEKLAYYRADR